MSKQFELANAQRADLARSINVSAIAKVVKFDKDKMTVDVQPLSKSLTNGSYEPLPMLVSVPVAVTHCGGFLVKVPYKEGDIGIVLYLDHDIDRILAEGGICEPNTERNHAQDDAVFIGNILTDAVKLPAVPENALVVTNDAGTSYIAFDSAGITIKGNIKIDGNISLTGDIDASGISLKTHTHTAEGVETSPPRG